MSSIVGGILAKLAIRRAKAAMPDVLKAVKKFIRDDAQAELLAREISGELSKTELDGSIETRNAEVKGTLKQKSWRPDWMYMLRNLLYLYFGATILMLSFAFFAGIARGKVWPTAVAAIEFYGVWLGIGAMLTTLTTASFAIYGYKRSDEKIASGEPANNIVGSITDFLRPRRALQRSETPNRSIPVVRTSAQARRRLDKSMEVNPTRIDAEPKQMRKRVDVDLDAEQDVYVPEVTGEPVQTASEARPYVGHRIEVKRNEP